MSINNLQCVHFVCKELLLVFLLATHVLQIYYCPEREAYHGEVMNKKYSVMIEISDAFSFIQWIYKPGGGI